jgi:hypothetical protein
VPVVDVLGFVEEDDVVEVEGVVLVVVGVGVGLVVVADG